MVNEKKRADRFDWTLAFILFLFFITSIVGISSAQTDAQYPGNYLFMQAAYYVIGAIIIACAIIFDPDQYKKLAWYLYGFGLFMLIGLHFAPESIAPRKGGEIGAKSWFQTPFGNIQPSEFMKTFLIIALARLIVDHHEKYIRKSIKTDFFLLAKIGITVIVPMFFILKQPDLGTGLVFIAITIGIILLSGISWKIIVPTFTVGAVAGTIIIIIMLYYPDLLREHLSGYQFGRIYSWLDPYSYSSNEGHHLISALQAIGSGEIFGKGYFGKEVYVAERHTDFIFSAIAEEWGFIGASFVISLYFLLIYHMIKLSFATNSPFNAYVIAGVISMITFHVFENIGMNLQLVPITGIPLPFLSYGGSSLMGNMLAIGIIFSIKFYHKKYMFSSDDE